MQMSDEIINEVRRVRHEISEACGHDPLKVVAYYREFQERMKKSGKYKFVSKPLRNTGSEPDRAIDS